MLERQRMVLESRRQVGLGQVPRVIGFRGQADIRQAEIPYKAPLLDENGAHRLPSKRRVDEHEPA